MKMKRYFACDTRQALRDLREEQGPDAVILSNRKVEGGVEIIAAMDYEDALADQAVAESPITTSVQSGNIPAERPEVSVQQSTQTTSDKITKSFDVDSNHMDRDEPSALIKIKQELKNLRNIIEAPLMQFAWGDMEKIKPMQASLLKQLMTLGLSSELSENITRRIADQGLNKNSWLESVKLLSAVLPVSDTDLIENGGVIALVGPTGVGKTTTIAKLAARFALKHGRRNVSLITTDSYRIGAHEQLRTYGRILGIPVQIATDAEELKNTLKHDGSNDYDNHLTLIDTAGVSQTDVRLAEHLATLRISGVDIKNYLVLSATGQIHLQDNVIKEFSRAGLEACVLTKTDEASSLGEVLSVLIKNQLPVAYVCNGQKVPDDIDKARGKFLVKQAVKLMQRSKRAISDEEMAYSLDTMMGGINV